MADSEKIWLMICENSKKAFPHIDDAALHRAKSQICAGIRSLLRDGVIKIKIPRNENESKARFIELAKMEGYDVSIHDKFGFFLSRQTYQAYRMYLHGLDDK